MQKIVWLNGEFVEGDRACVPILSHGFGRGSAVFEVVDITLTQDGPAFFGLREHIDRFFNSADLMYLTLPLGKEALTRALIETAKANHVSEGVAKFFAYMPSEEMGVVPRESRVDVAIFCMDFKALGVDQTRLSKPVTVGISTVRKTDPDSLPPQAKVAGAYVNGYLARMEARRRGYDDVIMLDSRGFITEGATSNAFFVRHGRVVTATLRNVLPGITRMAAVRVLGDLGYEVEEVDLTPADLTGCDEGFYTTSYLKIEPMTSLDGRVFGPECPGPVTRDLLGEMQAVYSGQRARYKEWLTLC